MTTSQSGQGIDEQAPIGVRRNDEMTAALREQRIPVLRRNRQAALNIQI